jgi:hypothetical protein
MAFIKHKTPKLLSNSFTITLQLVRHFIKITLGWSYILFTITTTKLPPNWKNPRTKMTYKVACLVKTYNILTTLVINTNETSVHLIHTRKERTHIQKGKKHTCLGD